MYGERERRTEDLHRLLDFAATNAIGADAYPLGGAVDQGADGLQVGAKYPFRAVVGMTDVVS